MKFRFTKKPDIVGTLMQIEPGETAKIKYTYAKTSAIRTAASKLSKRGYNFTCTEKGVLGTKVTRIS